MDQFQHCPICTKVPEQNIYQCSKGHIMCHLCASEEHDLCPQCMTPYEYNKIRCAVLEEILDRQDYECKFKDGGCEHIMKRGEITSHTDSCDYNPQLFPLCEKVGFKTCKYKGSLSKSDVIYHFEHIHGLSVHYDRRVKYGGKLLMDLMSRKRNSDSSTVRNSARFPFLVTKRRYEDDPVFLVYGRINKPVGFLTFVCIKVWESGEHPSVNYRMKCELSREALEFPSHPDSFVAQSSSNPLQVAGMDPFPFIWTLKVYSVQEAPNILKECPINISLGLLRECRFGESEGYEDDLYVGIYPVHD